MTKELVGESQTKLIKDASIEGISMICIEKGYSIRERTMKSFKGVS